MKVFVLLLIYTISTLAFDLEISKEVNINKKYSQKSKVKFLPISPIYKARPLIKKDYTKAIVLTNTKLTKSTQYDPFAESKKVANEIENTKIRSKISNIHTDSNIKHIIYKSSEKSLSQKKFIQSLASFNQ